MNYSEDRVVDEFLVMRCQAGDEIALSALVTKWQPPFLKYASVMTRDPDLAADVLQEAWIKIIKHLPGLRDPLKFPGWAYRIINNQCLDALRKQRAPDTTSQVTVAPINDFETSEQVWHILAQLSAEHRSVLALHYLQGFDVAEIAAITNKPAGTVKSRLHHAREKFRILLEQQDDSNPRTSSHDNSNGQSGRENSSSTGVCYRPA